MIKTIPPYSFTFSAAHSLATQTFRQFLTNPFFTSYEEPIRITVAQTLYQNLKALESLPITLPSANPVTVGDADTFLSELRTCLDQPQLSPIIDRPVSEGIQLEGSLASSRLNSSQVFSLGPQTNTMLDYLGSRLLGLSPSVAPTHLVTDPTRLKHLIAEKVVYEVLPETIDPQERRASYKKFHAPDLDWAEGVYKRIMETVSPADASKLNNIYRQIISLNEEYRSLFFADDPEGSVETQAQNDYHRAKETRLLEFKVESLEVEWQTHLYTSLENQYGSKASFSERYSFTKAFSTYKKVSGEYKAYQEKMLSGDKDTRENERKKREEMCFHALWDLYIAACDLLKDQNKQIPLTTFLWRTQSYRIDQGPTGMRALEVFYELTHKYGNIVQARKRQELDAKSYDQQAASQWALSMLVTMYSGIRLLARESDSSMLFRHHRPEDIAGIQGAEMFLSSRDQKSPSQGNISAWDHTGAFDYCGIIGALYLFGLEPDSIIAEKVFNYIPVMRGHLKLTTGGFLDRKKPSAIYEIMNNNIKRGRSNALFDSGTRLLSFPFVSPYAPLHRTGVLFVPNEYIPRRNIAGMHVRYEKIPDAERLMMANNFHAGGVPSPDIPRDLKGFLSSHNMFGYTSLGTRSGFAALAKHFKPQDMPRHKGGNDFIRRQIDVALLRAETTRVGFAADAGPFLLTRR